MNNLDHLMIKTSRLILRIPTDQEITNLSVVVVDGIQKPGEPHFQDDSLYDKSPEEVEKWLKEFIGKNTSSWNQENWQIPFCIFFEEKPIGLITMYSKQFPIARGFGCSYWLGLKYQGQGLGTEAVQAILSLGFDYLNGQEAYVGAWSDNIASIRIMEKLGFVFNGEYWMVRQGKAVKDKRMRLSKESWKKPDTITIEGLEKVKNLFE